jgi:YlmC/YmxH family sporulation protein
MVLKMESFSKLQNKELVNVSDGARLGYACDLELDTQSGKINALIVPTCHKGFHFGKCPEIRVPWECIRRIGEDLILVCLPNPPCVDKKT